MAMTYPGGKGAAGVMQRLINQIPPHDVFVSPFLGHCAVLRKIKPAAESFGIDLSAAALDQFAESVRAKNRGGVLRLIQADGIQWLRHTLGCDARYNFGEPGGHAATFGDATMWFLFVDPPYPTATRRNGKQMYDHELTDDQHAELLDLLLALRLRASIMVCSYPNSLYDDRLAGWRTFDYQSQTRRGTATERVWCNYSEPTTLHDYQFIGADKRERERIRRRVRNWCDGLARMDDRERGAVLQAIGAQWLENANGAEHPCPAPLL
jgi:hypothetical protein